MRALIAGGGMAGLMTALALRESGVFTTIDVFEQARTPSTAGAGLNIPPNGARLARWLGVDPHRDADGLAGRLHHAEAARPQHGGRRQRRLPSHAPPRPADVPPQAGPRVRARD